MKRGTYFNPSGKWTALAGSAALLAVLALPGLAMAEEAAPEYLTQANANVVWTLVAAILVMFMQAGFAAVECGLTRAKNTGNIMMKNMFDFSAGSLVFFLFGFALMFGDDVGSFLGWSNFALSSASTADADSIWNYTFWFFQCVFAATAVTIVSGAIAERTKFIAYLFISICITGIIYPISGHWIWGGGWLSSLSTPMIDFAGSTVVHSVGGWCALAGAILVGPRIGKYTKDGASKAIPGHNIPLFGLGVFILWFGWFGFNPGSTTTADASIGVIAATTNLAAAAGGVAALFTAWMRFGKPDVSMSFNGVLAGLVGITAGCANVSPVGAIVIGLGAGVLVILSVEFIDKVLKVDDPVGAISVHGVCGAFGTLMVGLLASPDFGGEAGLFYGGGVNLLITQIIGVGAVFIWAFGLSYILFLLLKITVGIRVSEEEELKGLDLAEHGGESYNGFQIFTTE